MERKNLPKINKLSPAKILLILGMALLVLGAFTSYSHSRSSVSVNSVYQVGDQSPISVEIPSIKTNLAVTKGGIVDNKWVLSDNSALFLPTSGALGEGFNTIIYAHNTNNLFGYLRNTKIGDLIVLKNKNGKEFKYKIISKNDVDPKDLTQLRSSTKNSLTLFTCDGWADSSRLLLRAVEITDKS